MGGFHLPALRISSNPNSWSVAAVDLVLSAVIMDSEIKVRLEIEAGVELRFRLEGTV
jgi:hypothetical protein